MPKREIKQQPKESSTLRKSNRSNREKRKLNRQAVTVTVIFTAIFLFMVGFYVYFLLSDSQTVINNSYNKRIDDNSSEVVRGTIYSTGGKKLAYTDTNDTEDDFSDDKRIYPYGKIFAHAIGITTHGKYGLEKQYNYDLLSSESGTFSRIIQDFTNTTPHGCDIYTTLNVSLQKASYYALGDNDGAVFAMDPDTGAILAMTSKPSYDPETVDDIWDELEKNSDDSRLLNRATQGKYIPGSVFKIVTTLEYIRENENYDQYSYYCNGSATFGGFSIKCFNGSSHYSESLMDAFAYSCNSAFSSIGDTLNVTSYAKTAEDLMFNSKLPLEMEYSKSVFTLDKDSSQFDITQTSIGQGETTVSPAHMCMIASAIANDGMLKTPYMVKKVTTSDGKLVEKNKKSNYKRLMTKDEASILQEYMEAVVDYGTARVLSSYSYDAYGKTGTAELDKNDDINSWFVGYAKKDDQKIAIAVVLENVRQGSDTASGAAKEIFDAYFNQ